MSTTTRLTLTADALRELPSRLTERDRFIIRVLAEHRVLTTPQVADLGFTHPQFAERRLRQLYFLRVVDRVRPLCWPGSAPYHWLLDDGGAAVVAADRGVTVAELGWNRERVLASIMSSQRLAHLVGTNGFFTALIRTARLSSERCSLDEWWSERRCTQELGTGMAQPDAFGVWQVGASRLAFFLEYDCGTERPASRLAAKLPGYVRLARSTASSGTPPWWLLFSFPGERREASVRRALRSVGVPIATCARGGADPAAAIWRPLDGDGPQARVALSDVAGLAQQANASVAA